MARKVTSILHTQNPAHSSRGEGLVREECKVIVQEESSLHKRYLTDKNIKTGFRGSWWPLRTVHPLINKLDKIEGIQDARVFRYGLLVELANDLFSWDDVEPKILDAISQVMKMPVEVVKKTTGPKHNPAGDFFPPPTDAVEDFERIDKEDQW